MKTHELDGFLDLLNSPPNNWENPLKKKTYIYLIWLNEDKWESRLLFSLEPNEYRRLTSLEFPDEIGEWGVVFVYPSHTKIPEFLSELPSKKYWYGQFPAWRCTSGFFNKFAQVSYQSDLEPLPEKASLLTFHPFIQYKEIDNYLIVLNLNKKPIRKEGLLHMYESSSYSKKGTTRIFTNALTTIPLDQFNFEHNELPVFYSPDIPGIPFGLGIKKDKTMLSLEHTHPPASLVLFGDRRSAQGIIKKEWIRRLEPSVENE